MINDNPRIDYQKTAWLNANNDVVEALMESDELLKKIRELIDQRKKQNSYNERDFERIKLTRRISSVATINNKENTEEGRDDQVNKTIETER